MENIFKHIKHGVPASWTAQINMMEWRDSSKKNFVARYAVTELAFAGTVITSALEGVGAIVASLIVNGLNYVVPRKHNFKERVVTPVSTYRNNTLIAFSRSIAALGYNVTTKEPIKKKTIAGVDKFYFKLGQRYEEACTNASRAYNSAHAKIFGTKEKEVLCQP